MTAEEEPETAEGGCPTESRPASPEIVGTPPESSWQGCNDDPHHEDARGPGRDRADGRGTQRSFAGGRRRVLVDHRESLPGDRPRLGCGPDAEVHGLSQWLAARA